MKNLLITTKIKDALPGGKKQQERLLQHDNARQKKPVMHKSMTTAIAASKNKNGKVTGRVWHNRDENDGKDYIL